MSPTFSLNGAMFTFHCLSPLEQEEVTTILQHHNGTLYDATKVSSATGFVFVITSYWADCEYNSASQKSVPTILFEPVTRFWLLETLRLKRWLRRDSHPFFQPPPRPVDLWLQYPMEYQDARQVEKKVGIPREVEEEMTQNKPESCQPRAIHDTDHRMRLSCSPNFLFRNEVPLWPYISAYLAQPICNMDELATRLHVLTLSDPRRRFNCLEYAVNELLTREEQITFFKDVLPQMARLVLDLPQMFPTPPLLLTPLEGNDPTDDAISDSNVSTTEARARVMTRSCRFSKLEVLTLVCGCFFGIFPDQDIGRSTPSRKANRRGYDTGTDVIRFPCFTAIRLFSAPGNMGKLVVLKGQKIRCILQYFLRVVPLSISKRELLEKEVIDFTRIGVHLPLAPERMSAEQMAKDLFTVVQNSMQQDNGNQPRLYAARCVSDTPIEELDYHLQIDFANKFAGGGVLTSGCVQEEIRFLLSPELLVSCLVFAKLEPHEAFVIHGTERYCTHEGYGGSFVCHGNFEDITRFQVMPDGNIRRNCVIVGMDATDYGSAQVERQYTRGHIWRELVKAYAGFAYPEASNGELNWPVASGNWGCGVFKGDRELKFLIQWLAASLHRRELVYVLFESDSYLQTMVDPLLTLATSSAARKCEVLPWLMAFLLDETNFDRKMRTKGSVLTHALCSLEQALASFRAQVLSHENDLQCTQVSRSPLVLPASRTKELSKIDSSRSQELMNETMTKKSKTMKTASHQSTLRDHFVPEE
uniref:poly(ADP-ribose) glycohydrolase n=1 Tax=Peronospora matthiolae TaxID=2874970 RepID=A0AAV1UC64_9STRA